MHESALARQLLGAVLERAPMGQRVLCVRGWLAETEALNDDAIAFHFRALARDTRACDARLELELIHTEARCSTCDTVYRPEHHLTLCPRCGSTDAVLLGPTGLGIDSIDVE